MLYCLFHSLAVGWNSVLKHVGCPAACHRPVMFVKDVNNCLDNVGVCKFTVFVYVYGNVCVSTTHTPR